MVPRRRKRSLEVALLFLKMKDNGKQGAVRSPLNSSLFKNCSRKAKRDTVKYMEKEF